MVFVSIYELIDISPKNFIISFPCQVCPVYPGLPSLANKLAMGANYLLIVVIIIIIIMSLCSPCDR